MNKYKSEIHDRLVMARNRIDEMLEANGKNQKLEPVSLLMVSREMDNIDRLNGAFDVNLNNADESETDSLNVKTIPDTDPMVKTIDLESGTVPLESTVKVSPTPAVSDLTGEADSPPTTAENGMASA